MIDLLLNGLPTSPGNIGSEGRPKTPAKTANATLKRRQSQKLVASNPISGLIRGANNLVLSWRDGLTESEREDQRRTEERKQILAARMQNAKTVTEWETAAEELDRLEDNDEWKLDPFSGDYHPELIEARLKELDAARTNCDIRTMMHLIRTALSRDLGGMGNIDLYRHSYIGTKELIERYVDSAVKTIEALVDKSAYALPVGMESKDLLEGILYARQSFGRSALLLSGGATFGMAHIGVVKSLSEARLLPRIISGASAGSIVCAVLCTRKNEELPDLVERFPYGDLAVFEGDTQQEGVADHIRRLLTEGSWSDISHLTRVMRGLLGDMTFQEAYNRTRRICNICVSTASIYELPRLLNYITAPNVMIWSAVAASCSVPLVFNAAPLLVKDPTTGAHVPWDPTPQRWIDGSVDNDLPMTRLAEMFNVNHFIVSQVNPHVVPFLSKDDRLYPGTAPGRLRQQQSSQENSEWLYTLTTLAKDEALHRLHFLTELGVFPNVFTKLRSILSQKYSGDITILPEIALQDLPRILKNPTPEFMLRNCLSGERATWPKLSRVRDRCAIELALDNAVHALRARVVFSQSQVDLRRLAAIYEPLTVRTGIGRAAAVGSTEQQPSDIPGPDDRQHHQHQQESFHQGRRGSGSGIQLMVRHRKIFQSIVDDSLTDDETEEEERLEMMNLRKPASVPTAPGSTSSRAPPTITKPRLKRSAKSQHLLSGPAMISGASAKYLVSPIPNFFLSRERLRDAEQPTPVSPSTTPFDFSKPITPPQGTATMPDAGNAGQAGSESAIVINGDISNTTEGSGLPVEIVPIEVGIQEAISCSASDAPDPDPRESDAYAEEASSRTDESDTDPYQEHAQAYRKAAVVVAQTCIPDDSQGHE
ncbi:putative lipase [Diplogelasinospora grovesii]|uniref:Patatin-like phospholipase domain-containing protein n=1 Tax=Diplogelasinospora grovesii TaxID=303347 RepID=A0AAN6S3I5_9PEZI|nr:putative lipase [Diplogelasinospora grovesii]